MQSMKIQSNDATNPRQVKWLAAIAVFVVVLNTYLLAPLSSDGGAFLLKTTSTRQLLLGDSQQESSRDDIDNSQEESSFLPADKRRTSVMLRETANEEKARETTAEDKEKAQLIEENAKLIEALRKAQTEANQSKGEAMRARAEGNKVKVELEKLQMEIKRVKAAAAASTPPAAADMVKTTNSREQVVSAPVVEAKLQATTEAAAESLAAAASTSTSTTSTTQATPSHSSSMYYKSCSSVKEDRLLRLNFTLEEDVDYSTMPKCGHRKCFFRSQKETIGYIIGDVGYFRIMHKAWENSCSLQHKHIYTRIPPLQLNLSPSQRKQFLDNLVQAGIGEFQANKSYGKSTQLAILQVRSIQPRSSFAEVNLKWQPRHFEELYSVLTSRTKNSNDTTTPTAAIQRYVEEVQVVVELLYHFPRMAWDFQMMVLEDGSVVHYDLDRVGESPKKIAIPFLRQTICNIQKDAILLKKKHLLEVRKHLLAKKSLRDLYNNHQDEFFQEIEECRSVESTHKTTG